MIGLFSSSCHQLIKRTDVAFMEVIYLYRVCRPIILYHSPQGNTTQTISSEQGTQSSIIDICYDIF